MTSQQGRASNFAHLPGTMAQQSQNGAGSFVQVTNEMRGYLAEPPQGTPRRAGLLVFMEAFGLNDHIQDVCRRFAREGYVALAPDFFRGKSIGYNERDKVLDFVKGAGLTDDARVTADVRAAAEKLGTLQGIDPKRIGVVGFCMGGRIAFLAAQQLSDRVAASVSFYGGGIAPKEDRFGRPHLLSNVGKMQNALLFYGALDQSIAPDEIGRVAEALATAKRRYTISVFPDAGHAFFNDDRESYHADSSEQAWMITLSFFGRVLAPSTAGARS